MHFDKTNVAAFLSRHSAPNVHSLTQGEIEFMTKQTHLPYNISKDAKASDLMLKHSESLLKCIEFSFSQFFFIISVCRSLQAQNMRIPSAHALLVQMKGTAKIFGICTNEYMEQLSLVKCSSAPTAVPAKERMWKLYVTCCATFLVNQVAIYKDCRFSHVLSGLTRIPGECTNSSFFTNDGTVTYSKDNMFGMKKR